MLTHKNNYYVNCIINSTYRANISVQSLRPGYISDRKDWDGWVWYLNIWNEIVKSSGAGEVDTKERVEKIAYSNNVLQELRNGIDDKYHCVESI